MKTDPRYLLRPLQGNRTGGRVATIETGSAVEIGMTEEIAAEGETETEIGTETETGTGTTTGIVGAGTALYRPLPH